MHDTTRIKRARLGLLLCVALLLSACASTSGRDDAAEENSARKAAELNTQLGREYMSRGQYEIAMEKLKKAVASDEDFAPAHTMLAVLYETLGEFDDAGRHYREAVRSAPDNGDVNNNYGAFLCRTGQGAGADPYFERALEDPFYRTPAVAMANAGGCALGRGDEAAAETFLRKSLAYDNNFPDALLSMAALSYERDDFLRARAFLQRYESAGPMTAESLYLGFRIERQLSNERQTQRYRSELLQRFPDAPETAETQGQARG
jgi:type IV pilus assembly protein PilF